MEFKKVFRGYDPKQVDKYIAETAERESATRSAQRDRITELTDENYNLRERIVELQRRQNDVGEALIVAQRVASEIERNAKDYADRALLEAKKFYATWQAYSKTIVASFTDDEVASFNALERKIGEVIANYERKLKGDDAPRKSKPSRKMTPDEFVRKMEQTADELNARAQRAESETETVGNAVATDVSDGNSSKPKSANPIKRVEEASGQSVDLMELLRPEQSLEDLCSDLGLINSDEASEPDERDGASEPDGASNPDETGDAEDASSD